VSRVVGNFPARGQAVAPIQKKNSIFEESFKKCKADRPESRFGFENHLLHPKKIKFFSLE
jgi:hypothetical protein